MLSFYLVLALLLILQHQQQLVKAWRSSSDWHATQKVAPGAGTDTALYGFGVFMAEEGDVFLVGAPGNNEVYLYTSFFHAAFPNASVASVVGESESTFVFPCSSSSNNNTTPLPSNFKVWSQSAVLRVPSPSSQGTSGFGCALSMMSTISNTFFAAVGDFSEETGTGAVYMFASSSQSVSSLSFQSKLVASDASFRSYLGNSVAFAKTNDVSSSSILAVGANGALQSAGAVYLFASSSTSTSSSAISSWSQIAKLTAHDGTSNDNFGRQIATTKNSLLAVSAYGYKGGTGCVYLYQSRISGSITSYSFASRLSAPDATPGSAFGYSLSATSDFVLVGTSKQASTGTAYFFCNSYGKWTFSIKLLPSNGAVGDAFGGSVAISEQSLTAIVGAFHANNSIGTIYLYALKALKQQSASFVYEIGTCAAGASWTQSAQFFARPKSLSGDKFGRSIAISSEGKDFVVGSYFETSLGIAGPGSALAFRDYTPESLPLLALQGPFSVIAAGVLLGLSFFVALAVAAVVRMDRQDRVAGVLEDKARRTFRQRLQSTISFSVNPSSPSSPPPTSSDDVHLQVDASSSSSPEAQTDPLDPSVAGGALIEFRTRDYVFDFVLSIMLGSTSWTFIYILMCSGIDLVAVIIFFLLLFQLCPFLAIVSEIVRGARVLPRFLSPGISPRHLKLHPVSWTWTCLLVLASSLVFSLNLIRYLPWRQTVFAVTSRGYPTYRSFKYCELSSCSLSLIQIAVVASVLFAAPTKLAMQEDLVVNGAFVGLWSLVLLSVRFFYSFFVYVLPLLSRGRGFRTLILETIAGTSAASSSSSSLQDGTLRVDNNSGSSFSYTEEDDLDFFPNATSGDEAVQDAREEISLADLRETENETRDRILASNKKKWKASTTKRGSVETSPFHTFHDSAAAAAAAGGGGGGDESTTRTFFSRFSLEREQQRGERLLQIDVERKGLLVAAKPVTLKERLESMRPAALLGDDLEDGDGSENSSSDSDVDEVVISRKKLSKRK